jgi:hypothetical protein
VIFSLHRIAYLSKQVRNFLITEGGFHFVFEPQRPLGRPRRRWVDNNKMDVREIGWDGVDWIGLIWLRIRTSGGLL